MSQRESANPDHMAGHYRLESFQRSGKQTPQIGQPVRRSTQNQDRNSPRSQVLLIGDFLIRRDDHLESRVFRSRKKVAVLQSGKTRVRGRFTVMTFKQQA